MGSSFEKLVARRLTVKTDRNFDSRFRSYDFFYKNKKINNREVKLPQHVRAHQSVYR